MYDTQEPDTWLKKYGPLCALVLITAVLLPVIGWWRAAIAAFAALVAWSILVAIFKVATGRSGAAAEISPAAEAGDPPELVPTISALEAGRYAEVPALAAPYLNSESPRVRGDALRLTALAHSRLGDHAAAVAYWQRLAEIESDSHTWFNVATSLAMSGAFEEAEAAFEQMEQRYAVERGTDAGGSRPVQPMAIANYLQSLDTGGRPDLAVRHLETLAGLYRALHTTDATFLRLRQMPMFSVFLEKSLVILRKVKDDSALVQWYQPIYRDVDEEGKAEFVRLDVPY